MSLIPFPIYDDEALWLAHAIDDGELYPPEDLRRLLALFGPYMIVCGQVIALRMMRLGREFENQSEREKAIIPLDEMALWLIRRTILRREWHREKTPKGSPITDLLKRCELAILAEHERGSDDAIPSAYKDHNPEPDPDGATENPI